MSEADLRVLVVSDLHGDLEAVAEAAAAFRPDVLFCCGDWGDPDQLSERELFALSVRLPVHSTFGNHDPLDWFPRWKNADGSPVLLAQGEVREVAGLRVAAIGGIWAKSHKQPYYVTDEDVSAWAAKISASGGVDVLLTHGCPVGLADLTPKGSHGGQRCFLDAFHKVAPRVHLCGHLHVAQERTLKDGRAVLNVGATPEGAVALVERTASGLAARLVTFPRTGRPPAG